MYQSQIAPKLLATTFLIFWAWPSCCCQSSIFCKRLSCRYIAGTFYGIDRNSCKCKEFRLELLIFLEKPMDVFVRLACEHSSGWVGTHEGWQAKYFRSKIFDQLMCYSLGNKRLLVWLRGQKKGQMCCFCCCLTHGMRMPAVCPWQVKLPPQKFQCPEETKCVHSITIWPWIHLKPALHVSQFLNDILKTKSWSYTLSLS